MSLKMKLSFGFNVTAVVSVCWRISILKLDTNSSFVDWN